MLLIFPPLLFCVFLLLPNYDVQLWKTLKISFALAYFFFKKENIFLSDHRFSGSKLKNEVSKNCQ